jgi:hypothetical protein
VRTAVKKGELVEVSFLDHVEDGDEAIEFTVWGRVDRTTRNSILIMAWAFASEVEAAKNSNHENVKTFTIVRRAITALHKLKKLK